MHWAANTSLALNFPTAREYKPKEAGTNNTLPASFNESRLGFGDTGVFLPPQAFARKKRPQRAIPRPHKKVAPLRAASAPTPQLAPSSAAAKAIALSPQASRPLPENWRRPCFACREKEFGLWECTKIYRINKNKKKNTSGIFRGGYNGLTY